MEVFMNEKRVVAVGLLAGVIALLLPFLAACSADGGAKGGSPNRVQLIGTKWAVTEIEGRPINDKPPPNLAFVEDGRLMGNGSCNSYQAPVKISGSTIRYLDPRGISRTLMGCDPPRMDQEERFLAALAQARAFRIEADKLVLLDDKGAVRLRLARNGDAPVIKPRTGKPANQSSRG
jgi:heat shock protein HslJ